MAPEIATQESRSVARPLRVLVPLIKEDLKHGDEAAQNAGMPYYRAAGEKMLEAKPQLRHGEFQSWIGRNFDISYKRAAIYMRLAETDQKSRAQDFSSLADFQRRHLGHNIPSSKSSPPPWQAPIRDIISKAQENAERLAQENLNRAEEREAQRRLAIQLIDIGYKALASKFHPDKGGSRDAMARLNLVRARLKASA